MKELVHPVLLGWIVLGMVLFRCWRAPFAVLAVYVLGALFLPEVQRPNRNADAVDPLKFPGVWLTKPNVMSFAALAGSLAFRRDAWAAFRPRWFDLPVAGWCLVPLAAMLANGQSLYDAVSETEQQTLQWGVPYLMGRLFLGEFVSLSWGGVAVLLGGLLYAPLCLFEVRMGPVLHLRLYGWTQHDFLQVIRYEGFRPLVFMEHGLAVGFWMVAASLVGVWLALTGGLAVVRRVPGLREIDPRWLLAGLLVSTVLVKSTGALALGIVGIGVLLVGRRLRPRLMLALLLVAPPAYVVTRASGVFDSARITGWVSRFNPDRAQSLGFRFDNEDLLMGKAFERPLLGWGTPGKARLETEEGFETVTDGLWIIALGSYGWTGLLLLGGALLLPTALFIVRTPPAAWAQPAGAAITAIAVILALYATDCLSNAMLNPVYFLLAGGLSGFVATVPHQPDG
jgi:hypothetical protein